MLFADASLNSRNIGYTRTFTNTIHIDGEWQGWEGVLKVYPCFHTSRQ